MNPPPYRPPQESKNPLIRQFLLASLIALPIVAVIAVVVVYAIGAQRKTMASRAAWQNVKSSANQFHDDLKKNFDPTNGMTNVDLGKFDKMRETLKNASQNSTGDDASLAQAMTKYLDRLQAAAKIYQTATVKLREAHVLDKFDSSDKTQIPARREIVQQFLKANAGLKQTIMNSESKLRDDLTEAKLRESKIELFIEKFHASTASKNVLTMKIRQCDERIGAAMLDALDSLEGQWGHWTSDPTADKIRFESAATRDAYNSDLAAMRAAAAEQLKLQTALVNEPAS